MDKDLVKSIYKEIKKFDNIVIARHIGPDPDAIASQIALRDSIKKTFPNKNVLAVGMGVAKFKKYGLLDKSDFTDIKDALLIITDVPNKERVDGIEGLDYKKIIKIDHHPCEEEFANIALVDETASSTCEIIAELIFNSKLVLDKTIASNLFLGIASDSDRFRIKCTTLRTFIIVSRLIKETDLDFVPLYDILYERPLNEIKFHAYLSEQLKVSENGFAYVKISSDVIKEYKVDTATASNMVNDFNYIKDLYVWTFITYDEKNEIFKVNIRSRGPVINEIASKYNGGGHKFASGVRTSNEKDIDNLLKDLDLVCKEYKQNLEDEIEIINK